MPVIANHVLSDLHFRGAEFTTPNIDALAQSGVILDQYYVQVSRSPHHVDRIADWLSRCALRLALR